MNFETDSLESMCELVVDCPHSTPEWTDNGIVVLRNQNIRNGQLDLSAPSYTNQEGYEARIKRATPQPGDIVFTREAPMGEVCLIPDGLKCCLGQRQVLLRPRKDIYGAYLYWALQSPYVQHQISWNEGTGTTVSNVRIPVLKALQIPRQGDSEIAIAKVLNSLSQKIQFNQQINQTLEQMAQAIFKSWFVDFEPVKAKIAALEAGGSEEDANLAAMQVISGKTLAELQQLQTETPDHYQQLHTTAQHFPSAMQDTELGEIPKGWRLESIENILARLRVPKRYTKKQVTTNGTVPVFEQGANILLGHHNDKPGFDANMSDPVFIFGDHTCITHISCTPFDISQNVIPLKGSIRSTIWTYYAVQGKQEFQEYRRHWSELIVKKVILPCETLPNVFANLVSYFLEKKEQLGKENRSLSSLRDELLPKLLSGELSVENLE